MEFTKDWARQQDQDDVLHHFRNKFLFPQHKGEEVIYFTGNSLGLQPKSTKEYLLQELNDWEKFGVEGHFLAKNPWMQYHEFLTPAMAAIVGGQNDEVVMMNQLTSNLHFLMVSFYRPDKQRYKILCEAKAFPSDQYALQSQVKFHGYEIDDALIELSPREGEFELRLEDVLKAIEENKNELALVMMGGVNYYSGQVFDIKAITAAANKAGIVCGWDLAHAAGNIHLELHNWGVDFACWCSYKYLNSGPGSVAGAFVHQKHHADTDLPMFAGWWGTDKKTRFKMNRTFEPIPTVERWQLSNASVLSMAACKASLDIFNEAGMGQLIRKSHHLTAYLQFIVEEINKTQSSDKKFEIITPRHLRGAQLSVIAHGRGKELYNLLIENGVIPDWREPNVIRMAPAPLYNSFEDIYKFGEVLKKVI
jgi:kynureninase